MKRLFWKLSHPTGPIAPPSTNPSIGPSGPIRPGRGESQVGTIGQNVRRVDEATIRDMSLCVRNRARLNMMHRMSRENAVLEAMKYCKQHATRQKVEIQTPRGHRIRQFSEEAEKPALPGGNVNSNLVFSKATHRTGGCVMNRTRRNRARGMSAMDALREARKYCKTR